VDALRRLAALEQTDGSVVRDVEQVVQTWLRRRIDSAKRSSGVAAVASILRAAPAGIQEDLLAQLGSGDRTLADRLAAGAPTEPAPAPPPMSVEKLDSLSAHALAAALEAMDQETALLALAGTAPDAVNRALGALPRDRALRLRRSLADLGPVSLRDVDAARQELAMHAAKPTQNAADQPLWRAAG
ncbi:MAG: FliG C-terminal domain-containing protein, partial [Pirellulales bacterium]